MLEDLDEPPALGALVLAGLLLDLAGLEVEEDLPLLDELAELRRVGASAEEEPRRVVVTERELDFFLPSVIALGSGYSSVISGECRPP